MCRKNYREKIITLYGKSVDINWMHLELCVSKTQKFEKKIHAPRDACKCTKALMPVSTQYALVVSCLIKKIV